jgi:histidine ammonia-lyase
LEKTGMSQQDSATVTIGDRPLDVGDVVAIARGFAKVRLSDAARQRLAAARSVVERLAAGTMPIYGLNTGLGAGVDTRLSGAEMSAFQRRVLLGRAVAIGPRLGTDQVRAMIAARLAGLAQGASGISPAFADTLVDLLNGRVHPVVPATGSVGESDLALLAHAFLPLVGEGEAELHGEILPGAEALRRAGIAPPVFGPKDGLALVSANSGSVGIGALVLADARLVLAALDAAMALSLEGFRGNPTPFDARLQALRPAPGQVEAARRLRALLAGSLLNDRGVGEAGGPRRVQDPLSLRCFASVQGAALFAFDQAESVLGCELAGAGDNPAVLVHDGVMISNGNFDVTALALAFEMLGQALAQCAILATARIAKLQSPALSELPRFLTAHGATHAGLAVTQKTAAVLEAEIRHLAQPVTLMVAATADGVEDYATLAPRVMAKTGEIAARLALITALELVNAGQALALRRPERLGAGVERVLAWLRGRVAALDGDRPLGPEIERLGAAILRGELVT